MHTASVWPYLVSAARLNTMLNLPSGRVYTLATESSQKKMITVNIITPQKNLTSYLPADVRFPCMYSTTLLSNAAWCSAPRNAMEGRTLSTTLILAARLLSTKYFTRFLPMNPTPPRTKTLGLDIFYACYMQQSNIKIESKVVDHPTQTNQRTEQVCVWFTPQSFFYPLLNTYKRQTKHLHGPDKCFTTSLPKICKFLYRYARKIKKASR